MRAAIPAIPFAAGLAAGLLFVLERRRREAAERFAAAGLEVLLNAIDANDPQTGAHVRRVAAYASVLADAAELDEHERLNVERVALFHDIGKVNQALFDIIHDTSRLTSAERRKIAKHPQLGAQVLEPLTPFYPDLCEGVLSHHERWDGQGYPRRLRGRRIPTAARIVTLADTYDAITHGRRYRSGKDPAAAASIISAGRGTQFDPELVDLMLLPPVFAQIREQQRILQQPRVVRRDRREGKRERMVPDIMFRWRPEGSESLPQDQPHQRSH
jgi:putative nucleotidyltransferase with HDIG domain